MGSNGILGGGGFHHVALRVYDIEASIKFYTEILGFKERVRWGEDNGRGILLDTGDGNYFEIFAGGTKEPKPEGAFFHLALRSDNLEQSLEAARAAGMEVTMEPTHIELGGIPVLIAFFKGPDGEVLELFQSTSEDKL
jgi:glyoxylase I family protein